MQLINIIPRARKEVPVRRDREYSPASFWHEFDSPLLEMERMFDRLFVLPSHDETRNFSPSLDLHENEKIVEINVEVPGMTARDIEISLTKNSLTISGEKKEKKEENSRGVYRLERRYGLFSRTIPLPENGIDVDGVEASYNDGVLTIKLPKVIESKEPVKKIPVLTGQSESQSQDEAPEQA